MKKRRFNWQATLLLLLWSANVYGASCENASYRFYEKDNIQTQSVVNALAMLATQSLGYAKLISVGSGTTYEGREIKGIVISKNATADNNLNKPDVIITGAIHANEWIGAEVAIGLAEYLIDKKIDDTPLFGSKGMTIKKLLENVEVVIIPVLNPDGYEYSRMTDNTWRKNRRDLSQVPAAGSGDIGVDLNRNFSFKWDVVSEGTSTDPADSTYCGPAPASEYEIQAIMGMVSSRDTVATIDYHGGVKQVLHPWAYTSTAISEQNEFLRPYTKTKDKDLFREIAQFIAHEIGCCISRPLDPCKKHKTSSAEKRDNHQNDILAENC